MIDVLKFIGDMIEDSRQQAIKLYAEQQDCAEDEVEAFHPHEVELGGDKMAITWLCYKKGSFIRWPEEGFILAPWFDDGFMLDGGILDLGLRETDA